MKVDKRDAPSVPVRREPATRLLLLCGMMVPLLLLASCAPGGRFENYGWVYQTRDENCTHARAEVETFGEGGGLFRQQTAAKYAGPGTPWGEWTPCAVPWSRPDGYLAGKMTFFKWGVPHPPLVRQWYICTTTDWYYSDRSLTDMNAHVGYNPGRMPCGSGPYFNATEAHVRNGGTWFGGPLNTDWLEMR